MRRMSDKEYQTRLLLASYNNFDSEHIHPRRKPKRRHDHVFRMCFKEVDEMGNDEGKMEEEIDEFWEQLEADLPIANRLVCPNMANYLLLCGRDKSAFSLPEPAEVGTEEFQCEIEELVRLHAEKPLDGPIDEGYQLSSYLLLAKGNTEKLVHFLEGSAEKTGDISVGRTWRQFAEKFADMSAIHRLSHHVLDSIEDVRKNMHAFYHMVGAGELAQIHSAYQQWIVFRRPRPCEVDKRLAIAATPLSPSYPADLAVVFGAMMTVIRIYSYRSDEGQSLINQLARPSGWPIVNLRLTETKVAEEGDKGGDNSEIDRLEGNLVDALCLLGYHYRSDAEIGMEFGEEIAIEYMREALVKMREKTRSFRKRNGQVFVIESKCDVL
jgi:hypothetical protein